MTLAIISCGHKPSDHAITVDALQAVSYYAQTANTDSLKAQIQNTESVSERQITRQRYTKVLSDMVDILNDADNKITNDSCKLVLLVATDSIYQEYLIYK